METKDYIIRKNTEDKTYPWVVISKTADRIITECKTKKYAISLVEKWESEGRK